MKPLNTVESLSKPMQQLKRSVPEAANVVAELGVKQAQQWAPIKTGGLEKDYEIIPAKWEGNRVVVTVRFGKRTPHFNKMHERLELGPSQYSWRNGSRTNFRNDGIYRLGPRSMAKQRRVQGLVGRHFVTRAFESKRLAFQQILQARIGPHAHTF